MIVECSRKRTCDYGTLVHRPCKSSISSIQNCHGRTEQERSGLEWKGFTPEWKGFDNKSGGTTLASAHALCLDQLSHVWLRISEGLNCCQESRRGVV